MHLKKNITYTAKIATTLSLLFMLSSNSLAVNMQFLKYSPVSDFTAEDFEMLQNTGKAALKENKDGVSSEWKNAESKNSGIITPLKTLEIDGMHCRKTKIENHTETRSGNATFTFCKTSDNKWKLLK